MHASPAIAIPPIRPEHLRNMGFVQSNPNGWVNDYMVDGRRYYISVILYGNGALNEISIGNENVGHDWNVQRFEQFVEAIVGERP